MKKKRFLSWVLIFTLLFSMTAGMQKAWAEPSGTPDPHLVGWGMYSISAVGTETGADRFHAIKCTMYVPNMAPFLNPHDIRTGIGDIASVMDSNFKLAQGAAFDLNFGSNLVYLTINVGGDPSQIKYYELNIIRDGSAERSELKLWGQTVSAINGTGNPPTPPSVHEPIYSGPYIIKVNVANSFVKIATSDIVSTASTVRLPDVYTSQMETKLEGDIPLNVGENKLVVVSITPSRSVAYSLIINRASPISVDSAVIGGTQNYETGEILGTRNLTSNAQDNIITPANAKIALTFSKAVASMKESVGTGVGLNEDDMNEDFSRALTITRADNSRVDLTGMYHVKSNTASKTTFIDFISTTTGKSLPAGEYILTVDYSKLYMDQAVLESGNGGIHGYGKKEYIFRVKEPFMRDLKITSVASNIAHLSFTTVGDYTDFYCKVVEGENPVMPTEAELLSSARYSAHVGTSFTGIANTPQGMDFGVAKKGAKYTCYLLTKYGTGSLSEVAAVSYTTNALPENCKILSVAGVSDATPFGSSMTEDPISGDDAVNYYIGLPSTVKTISPKTIGIAPGARIEMYTAELPFLEEKREIERMHTSYTKTPVTDFAPMTLYDGTNIVYAKVTNGTDSLYFRIIIERAMDMSNPDIPASMKLLSVAGLSDGIITGKTENIGPIEQTFYEYRMDVPSSLTQIALSDIGVPKGARVRISALGKLGEPVPVTNEAPMKLKTGENILYIVVSPYSLSTRSISSERITLGVKSLPGTCYKVVLNRSIYSNKLTINAGTGGSVTTGKSGYYASGDVVSVVATPYSGYRFNGWSTNNGGTFGSISNASTTFKMIEGNVVITASFANNSSGGNDRPNAGGATGGTTGGGVIGGGGSTTPSGKTEPGTSGSTGDVVKKLDDLMGKLADKTQQDVVANEAAKLLGDLSKATGAVQNNEGAVQAAGNVRDAITNASKIVKEVDGVASDAKIIGQVKDVLASSAQALDKIKDEAARQKATADIIAEGSKFLKAAGTAAGTEEIRKELIDMAEKAVADASTSSLKPTVVGGAVKARITAEVAADLLKSAEQNKQAIDELNKNLTEGGIKTDLEKTVILDLGDNPDMKRLSAEMSGKVLADLSKAGVRNLEIVSGDTSIKMKSDVVPAGTKSFSVEVKTVDKSQKGLTNAQKKFVETHTVIDINASITNSKGKVSALKSTKSKLEVEVPYTLREGQDPSKGVDVYVKLDNGTFKKYTGAYNSETKTVVLGVDKF